MYAPPLIFAKISFLHLWLTNRKLVCGPIGNWFVDLSGNGLWTYQKLVCGPIGNRFVDLSETSLWTNQQLVCGPIRAGNP